MSSKVPSGASSVVDEGGKDSDENWEASIPKATITQVNFISMIVCLCILTLFNLMYRCKDDWDVLIVD